MRRLAEHADHLPRVCDSAVELPLFHAGQYDTRLVASALVAWVGDDPSRCLAWTEWAVEPCPKQVEELWS